MYVLFWFSVYNTFKTVIKEGGLASWTNSNNPIKAFSVFCKVSLFVICVVKLSYAYVKSSKHRIYVSEDHSGVLWDICVS